MYKSNLEITDLQGTKVSSRQKDIRDVLKSELTVLDDFLSGSYSRSTLIAPLSEADVDVFVVLHSDYYKSDGQTALLDKVKRVLQKSYSNSSISRNGQAVTIDFADFDVDVVPAFIRNGGGYLIPNTYGGGSWISTDPKQHVAISAAANTAHSGTLVPLVKMIKGWNREIGHYFHSFHLEVLAWSIFGGVTISDYPSGCRYFFDKGRRLVRQQNPDPVYGGDVGYYINGDKIDQAESRFETAYNRAVKAEEYAAKGKVEDAANEWGKIFGGKFPAYG